MPTIQALKDQLNNLAKDLDFAQDQGRAFFTKKAEVAEKNVEIAEALEMEILLTTPDADLEYFKKVREVNYHYFRAFELNYHSKAEEKLFPLQRASYGTDITFEQENRKGVKELTPEELFQQGLAYRSGIGVTQNFIRARGKFETAAKCGYSAAYVFTGYCYYSGAGLPDKDLPRAKVAFLYGAFFGLLDFSEDSDQVTYMHRGVQCQAFPVELQPVHFTGYAIAQTEVGRIYEELDNLPPVALIFFEKASAQGDAIAQYLIGCGLLSGKYIAYRMRDACSDVPPSYALQDGVPEGAQVLESAPEALRLLERAAWQGYALAQCKLRNFNASSNEPAPAPGGPG
jgi:TPR repeat protein